MHAHHGSRTAVTARHRQRKSAKGKRLRRALRDGFHCRFESLEPRFFLSAAAPVDAWAWTTPDWSVVSQIDNSAYLMTWRREADAIAAAPYADEVRWESLPGVSDATATGVRYTLFEHYGGSWFDNEKTGTADEDDAHCWAFATSNVLAWTGWGLVDGMLNTDDIYHYFQDHWSAGGMDPLYAFRWWFDGQSFNPGQQGCSRVDVAGAGFYTSENISNYLYQNESVGQLMSAIDACLTNGYGVTLGISPLSGQMGHVITVWGFNYDATSGNYLGIWVTDSDDNMHSAPPNRLRYYQVRYDTGYGAWFLQDYYGTYDYYFSAVRALCPKPDVPRPGQDNQIRGTVWADANRNGARDAGEAALANQVVYIDANNNGRRDRSLRVVSPNGEAVNIYDVGTSSSALTVQSAPATITDVNVRLNLTHTYDGDLEAWLISPTGTRVQLFNRVGGSGDNFTGTVLDDEAATAIGSGAAPFSGSYRPVQALSAFDGENLAGTWTLELIDHAGGDTGRLTSWSLEITASERSTTTNASGQFTFSNLASGNYIVRHELAANTEHTLPSGDGYSVTFPRHGSVVTNAHFGVASSAPSATDLGALDFRAIDNLNPAANTLWYRCQTTMSGYLTVEALFGGSTSAATVRLYDANLTLLATSTAVDGGQRIDWNAAAGGTFYVSLSGTATDVDLRLANLVSLSGDTVVVRGTDRTDRFDFAAASWHQVTINQVHYAFNSAVVKVIQFDGGGGSDTAVLVGSTGSDSLACRPSAGTLTGANYTASVVRTEIIVVLGGGGTDSALLTDSAGDDVLVATPRYTELRAGAYYLRAERFAEVEARAGRGGQDVARLYDSAGNDNFVGTPTNAKLWGNGFSNRVRGFGMVYAYAKAGGQDVAKLYDSAGNDVFQATPTFSRLYGSGYQLRIHEFDAVYANATAGGSDTSELNGSDGDDLFVGTQNSSRLSGAGYFLRAAYFDRVFALGGDRGYDRAFLYDSAGDDRLVADILTARLSYLNGRRTVEVTLFRWVKAISSSGGHDTDSIGGIAFALETEGPWING